MKPTPYDAWALARVMSDQPLNGGLAIMTEPWKSMAEKLATVPPQDRQSGLDWLLCGWPDRKAVVEAIAGQDPMGPAPPIGNAPSGSNWPALRIEVLPPVDPFPVDVLPIPAARLV
jgi:hypothetical protein